MQLIESSMLNKIRSQPIILWISVIRRHKQPLFVADIAERAPNINFVMIGSSASSETELAEQLKKKCEFISNLFWIGATSDELKEKLIAESIAGLTTSIQEGFGLTPLEFLTHNKPVVAYPLDVFKEIYGDLLIYATNPDEFTREIKQIKDNHLDMINSHKKIEYLKDRYNIKSAAINILNNFDLKNANILILARDIPNNSLLIQGNYILEWQLWECVSEINDKAQVISNKGKFSKISNILNLEIIPFNFKISKPSIATNSGQKMTIYVLSYYAIKCATFFLRFPRKSLIMTSGGDLAILVVLLKLFMPIKAMCLIHDASFLKPISLTKSALLKQKLQIWVHRRMDYIITISNASAKEISGYLQKDVKTIWP